MSTDVLLENLVNNQKSKMCRGIDNRLGYLSCQGTWAVLIVIIQAVADVFNLKILNIESHPYFADITIVERVTAAPVQEQCAIFTGHMDEFHYVSTEPLTSSSSISQ